MITTELHNGTIVVFGRTNSETHNCDDMGCGSVGPHVLEYIGTEIAAQELYRRRAEVEQLTAERDALRARVAELEDAAEEAAENPNRMPDCFLQVVIDRLSARLVALESPPVVPEGWEVNRIDYEVDHDEYESRWELWALDADHVSFMVAYVDSSGEVNSPGGSASTTALGALFYAHRTNQRPPHAGDADG